ncbi:hypothetical protein Leryth_023248 [Lithospermum erythrorhizon]|nr:hypothetical protein Leryth_023248 [Lithospermum erythrorhizon]
MGNAISPSCLQPKTSSYIQLFFYDGTTRILHGKRLAAEIMFEFPDCMICHADSFFIGRPLPLLKFDEQLINGETYFVVPLDSCPPGRPLSASSLVALTSSGSKRAPIINFNTHQPFQYLKDVDGKNLIKVSPEFIIKLMSRKIDNSDEDQLSMLCSTPELKKHYDHLVGSREQLWSPRLETISEAKARSSPWLCIVPERKGGCRREIEG